MNKRIILIALVALLTIGTASAQLRFGVKAGVNVDNLKVSNLKEAAGIFDADNNCGFTGGVTMEYIAPVVGIGFDLSLMYAHLKAKMEDNGKMGTVGKNYLEIPLNLKYKLGIPVISRIIQPMVYTGPSFAFKLDKSVFSNIKTKTTQIGWNLGIGVELFKHLQINGGYTFGINNVAKYIGPVENNFNLENVKLKNNYWTITAAYMF